jgi:Endonuclease/Exonuclease/phosphatase family
MAKLFSVASWNVEHFKGDPSRVRRVVGFLSAQDPDIFALYEVEGAEVFQTLVTDMPDYTFQITEGPQTQEILIGVKRGLTAFITQKTEFRSGTTHMRPGQLVAVTVNGTHYALLFLHLSSGTDPRGMGLRDDMGTRAFDFRKVLDKAAPNGETARYIFLGDLNTMGLKYPFDREIDAATELRKWDRYGERKAINMRRLGKTHPNSWSNGSGSRIKPSNLDHVYSTENLSFGSFAAQDGTPVEVALRGWPELATEAEQDRWIAEFSDHALMYFEVHS